MLLALLALPVARRFLEGSMTLHMLVQYPLLMLCGALLASRLPAVCLKPDPAGRSAGNGWNAHGITGLFASAVILAILMIPRVLDLALISPAVEFSKMAALLFCGAALRLSWQAAGWLVQGFFLGQVLPMSVVVGTLYESSPVRVCNAYLLGDQVLLGRLLVWIAAGVALAWLAGLFRSLMRSDAGPIQNVG
ncbi:MAG: hypothetical protein H7Z77_03445 [Chitinophagaceae bacterium]|nr:hypothetical protein [Polaromonas sp.]